MKVRILLQKESNFMNNVDGYMRHYALSPVCIMVQQMLRLCMSVHCLLGWFGISSFLFRTNDLSIGSAETKYIKLNTKTQILFLITFDFVIDFFFPSVFLSPLSKSSNFHLNNKKNEFQYLVLCIWFQQIQWIDQQSPEVTKN